MYGFKSKGGVLTEITIVQADAVLPSIINKLDSIDRSVILNNKNDPGL
ncbi:hypothetical protein SAMN05216283_102729 [Sunxiuqinia elliptica]|uniref:Uncharacterized protein n=1 Tax=Sunxiuqinia elliptica TaxID=655355 RepID=A0A1I2G428_9BACT|nr:hypothetical protein SAMN05216283_102729 [Sunxiuqinia elliptica]